MTAGRGFTGTPPLGLRTWIRAHRRLAGFLCLLLLLDLSAACWLWVRPDPVRQLQARAQSLLDDAVGPGQTRVNLQILNDQRLLCSVAVTSGRDAGLDRLLTAALGLDCQRGDRLSVLEVPPPSSSPWPARVAMLATLMLAGWLSIPPLLRAVWQTLVRLRCAWRQRPKKLAPPAPKPEDLLRQAYESVRQELHVEALHLELSRDLLGLISPRKGALLHARIGEIRQQLARDRGVILPTVVVDEGPLASGHWRLLLRGNPVAQGQVANPGDPSQAASELHSLLLPELSCRASQLIGVQEVDWLLQQQARTHPALVKLVLDRLGLGGVSGVLRLMVEKGSSIRDLVAVLENLADLSSQPAAEER